MLPKATIHGRRLIRTWCGPFRCSGHAVRYILGPCHALSSVGAIFFVALPTFKGQRLSVIPVFAVALQFEYPVGYC